MIRSRRRYLLIAALVAASCLAGPVSAEPRGQVDASFAGADSGSTIAVVLAISGRPQGVLPVPVSSVKSAASNQLAATLSARGFTVASQENVFSKMREWRVRDGKSIPRGFLDDLADSLDVELLLVANLVIQPDRLIMTGRYLDPQSAVLLKVIMTELVIVEPERATSEKEITDWLVGARDASSFIADVSIEKPDSASTPVLILETQPVGCSASVALMADHALLQSGTEHIDWALIDPAVIKSTLQDAGYSVKYLGVEARALLQKTFACRELVIPGLTSYSPAPRSRGRLDGYDEFPERRDPILKDFAMNLRVVDLKTGSIASGKEVFLATSDGIVWFGIPRKETLMIRLKIASDQLWSGIHNVTEEF